MIHKSLVRLIVQKKLPPHEQYFPQVLTASVNFSYPFTVPTANVEIITNTSPETSGFVSPVRIDDVVRLQISVTYSMFEKVVWMDIFEGRIRDMESPYGDKNTTTLNCVGHIYETTYTLIEEDIFWSGSYDSMNMLNALCNTYGYLDRLSYAIDSRYVSPNLMLTDFNIQKDQKYFHDVLQDLEKISQHTYQAYTKTTYNSLGTLTSTYLCWKTFTEDVTTQYQVIEGTPRLLNAQFDSSTEDLYNHIKIYGDTYEVAVGEETESYQYMGEASDATSIASYGTRTLNEAITGLKSDNYCSQIASGIVPWYKDPFVCGEAKIFGTPYAKVGDLVHVKIPSLELNGESIDDNFRVVRVAHSISQNTFTTDLQFGKLKSDIGDYVEKISRKTRINNCNHIRHHRYSP